MLADRKAQGTGGAAVVRRVAVLGGALAGFLIVLGLAISPIITRQLFDHSWLLLVGFIIAIGAYFCGHLSLARSPAVGSSGPTASSSRPTGACVSSCASRGDPWHQGRRIYGLIIGISPIVALGFAFRRRPPIMKPGPEAPWAELTANLGWLLLASVSASCS